MNLSNLSTHNKYICALREIRKIIPSAIIAGGVIRDLYHDKQIHDVDIYVPNDPASFIGNGSVYSEIFWKTHFDLKTNISFAIDSITSSTSGDDEYEEKNHINMTWNISKNEILYNIIIVDIDPTEYVTKFFDVGLCKAYYDGTKIRLTSDFMRDSQNKTLTIVSESMSEEEFHYMMNKHIVKLQHKFPGHSLVIPSHYAEYYKEYNSNIKT